MPRRRLFPLGPAEVSPAVAHSCPVLASPTARGSGSPAGNTRSSPSLSVQHFHGGAPLSDFSVEHGVTEVQACNRLRTMLFFIKRIYQESTIYKEYYVLGKVVKKKVDTHTFMAFHSEGRWINNKNIYMHTKIAI